MSASAPNERARPEVGEEVGANAPGRGGRIAGVGDCVIPCLLVLSLSPSFTHACGPCQKRAESAKHWE